MSRGSRAAGSCSPGEGLTVVVSVAKGVVAEPAPILEERWSYRRAFAVTPWSGAAVFGVLALFAVLIGARMWRTGRDRRYAGHPSTR